MEIKDAIRLLKTEKGLPRTDYQLAEALQMAISVLEKQEVDKCCETCKHKKRTAIEWPCLNCYMTLCDIEDYYEPYTEEEA